MDAKIAVTATIDHKLQRCLSGGVWIHHTFSMACRRSFTPAVIRDVIMQVGHFELLLSWGWTYAYSHVRKCSLSGNNLMACGMQLYFSVSWLAITVEHLVVSSLYMFYTAVMSYYKWWLKHSSMWRWSTLSCIHWTGWGILGVCFGGPRNAYCHDRHSDVTLGVKIDWILVPWLLELS